MGRLSHSPVLESRVLSAYDLEEQKILESITRLDHEISKLNPALSSRPTRIASAARPLRAAHALTRNPY